MLRNKYHGQEQGLYLKCKTHRVPERLAVSGLKNYVFIFGESRC